jgi:pyruvate/2-oxoglutarate dehydrogenase complex dihydrolipoamide dehydrogenase (E3) component
VSTGTFYLNGWDVFRLPFCLFTDPETARVGLDENEAVAAGRPYRVAKLPMQARLRYHRREAADFVGLAAD